jgi:protein-tyrosine phosphatase
MKNTFWIIEDLLAGRPGPIDFPWSLKEFQNNGINIIINLTEDKDDTEELQKYNIESKWFPIPDDYPANNNTEVVCKKVIPEAYKYLESQLELNKKVVIHCAWGRDRTGLLLAYYLVKKLGMKATDAIKRVREKQPKAITAKGWEEMANKILMDIEHKSVIFIDVPEAEEILKHIKLKFNEIDPIPNNGPAHITIQFPWIPPNIIEQDDMEKVRNIFSKMKPFDYSMKHSWFGKEVLILIPEDPKPFIEMTKSILEEWPDYPYYGGDYDEIEPHITLAYGEYNNLKMIEKEIQEKLPIKAICSEIIISVGVPGQMKEIERINLNSM